MWHLTIDLYELTMAASYLSQGETDEAVFDLFVRHMPPRRGFLLACGVLDAVREVLNLRFSSEDIDYLRSLNLFKDEFLDYLRDFRFSGDIYAVPDGTPFFAEEPVIRVHAPKPEAQIIETLLLNIFNFQANICTKAARVVLAAEGRPVVDFSPRRDHGPQAALWVAKASYIAGAVGTSNVLAGKVYGIPVFGTMAHSYVMAFPSELEAFLAFARDFPENAIFLIDTYDTIEGARTAVKAAKILAKEGIKVKGVRIDSGDLAALSLEVRKILDCEGLKDVKILLSGDLDEYRIHEILSKPNAADSFGVGTRMGVSMDYPALGGVYKLAADSSGPKLKKSTGKITLPGVKVVHRVFEGGRALYDVIGLEGEELPGEPLLVKVVERGELVARWDLEEARERAREGLRALPPEVLDVLNPGTYPVKLSDSLKGLLREFGVEVDDEPQGRASQES